MAACFPSMRHSQSFREMSAAACTSARVYLYLDTILRVVSIIIVLVGLLGRKT